LPTAATLAHFGHSVVLAERDRARLAALRSGRMPIVEAGLDDLVAGGVSAGKLRFTESATEAVRSAQFVFLCVPTPQSADGSADLSYVESAAKEIGPHLSPRAIVVNKSTVPVGSATMVEQVIGRSDVSVVSNPEFLREGTAVLDSLHPDRIVVGAQDPHAAAMVGELFSSTAAPLIVTDATTSETIKYASNAFLATKLSFVNALAGLCEEVGADARDVLLGLGYDKRIGFEFLRPVLPAQGHPGAPAHRGRGRVRLLAAGRRHRVQRAAARARRLEGLGGVRRHGPRGDTRRVGAHVQGQHR
jgi:UDPglucose 6-dehydrogenase